jgi:hypothetical protein
MEMEIVQSQPGSYAFHFLDVALHGVERLVLRLLGIATPELVVENDAVAVLGKFGHGKAKLVRSPGTSVKRQDGPFSWLAEALEIDPVSQHFDVSFGVSWYVDGSVDFTHCERERA